MDIGKKVNIFCCSTIYHMLLSSLIAFENINKSKCENILVLDKTCIPYMNEVKWEQMKPIFNVVLPFDCNEIELKSKFQYARYRYHITQIMENRFPLLKKLKIYDQNSQDVCCYLCEDGHHFSRYFIYNYKTIKMLEEGMQIYKDVARNESLLKRFLKYKLLRIIEPNGKDPRIKELLVQYPENLPQAIRGKGRELNLKVLMDAMYQSEHKNKFFVPFNFSQNMLTEIRSLFNANQGEKVLLVTQPFSEDGLISEMEKIEIYKEIVKEIAENRVLLIKPHPREKTDYSSIFPGTIILEHSFPLELLFFVCKKNAEDIELAVTVDSTAVMNIKDICRKVKMYGLCEITWELSKKYPMELGYEN